MSEYTYIVVNKYGEVYWSESFDDASEVYHSSDTYQELYAVRFVTCKKGEKGR